MALTAYDDAAELAAFVADDGTKENSRIIGVVLIKKGFDVTTLTEDAESWDAGITAGDLVIINPVTGNWPEASETTVPGIGRVDTMYSFSAYDIPVRHKGVDKTLALYNKLLKSNEYGAGFMFHDNKMYIPLNKDLSVTIIDFFSRVSSEEDLEGDRLLRCNARWKSADFPYSIKAPASLFPF